MTRRKTTRKTARKQIAKKAERLIEEATNVVSLTSSAPVEDIVDSLTFTLNPEALFKVITDIDDAVCDLAFTKKLVEHFAKIVEDDEKASKVAPEKD